MSQFDRENNELFQMVRNNHHRQSTTTTVGIVVPMAQAQAFVEFQAAKRHSVADGKTIAFCAACLFLAVCGFVIPLVF